MKKWIAILLIAFMGVVWPISDALAPPQVGTTRLQDRNSANKSDIEQSAATLANTLFGLFGLNATYYWDTTTNNWRRQEGGPVNVDNVLATSRMPRVACFEYVQDAAGNWDRKLLGTGPAAAGVRVSPPTDARFQVSDDANQNTTTNRIWDNCNLDQILGTATSVSTGVTDAGTQRMIPADDSPGLTTAAPGYGRIQDGDSATLADVETANADGKALSLNPLATMAIVYLFNGATLDMARAGATGELQVTDVDTRPGEDAGNDWRGAFKDDTNVYNPNVTAGTAVSNNVPEIVCASTYLLNTPNWSVWVKNVGGGSADTFTDVDVQVSYNDADFSSLTSTACDILASGDSARCYVASNESIAWVVVYANVAAGDDTTADCVIQGNKN